MFLQMFNRLHFTLNFQAPLIRYEQMQKDFKEADDSWETETMITTFDLDEIETEIEVDYFVSFKCFTNVSTKRKVWGV